MSNSNEHNHNPLPMLLAGGASGAVKGGRHIRLAKNTTHSNLLLTILHKAGVRAEKIGDSTGIIEQLVRRSLSFPRDGRDQRKRTFAKREPDRRRLEKTRSDLQFSETRIGWAATS